MKSSGPVHPLRSRMTIAFHATLVLTLAAVLALPAVQAQPTDPDRLLAASGQIKAGKLRALAVTSSQRVPALAEVPTLSETVLPGFNSISWSGVLAPFGTLAAIIDKIGADLRDVLAADDVKFRITELGGIPRALSPAQFAELIKADRQRYAKIIRERKIATD